MSDQQLATGFGVSDRMLRKYRGRGFRGSTLEELRDWHGNHVRLRRGGPESSEPGCDPLNEISVRVDEALLDLDRLRPTLDGGEVDEYLRELIDLIRRRLKNG